MKDKYDVIIIGAGIGGLVCGCYLVKAGLKALIVEQHSKVGGYCTSFKRNKFIFDVGPHSLGSCRKDGQLGKLFRDFGLDKTLKIIRKDPSDIVITSDFEIAFYNDIAHTSDNLKHRFPKESKNISRFFNLLQTSNIGFLYAQLKKVTFSILLDKYFDDSRLKTIFSIMLGNLGLSSLHASAFTSAILYREYIFDGGYYPDGGMQSFANTLAKTFTKYGGIIKTSNLAKQIVIKNKHANGVITQDEKFYSSTYVVSNCDATYTYSKLLSAKEIDKKFSDKLAKLVPSLSFFVVYVGLKKPIRHRFFKCSTLWCFPSYDVENIYKRVQMDEMDLSNRYIVFGFPASSQEILADSISVMHLLVLAPFKSLTYWKCNRATIAEELIKRAERLFPDLSSSIEKFSIASPQDFYKYTFNRNGAISGWASIPSQNKGNVVPMKTSIKNLLMVGHWVTSAGGQGGIPMVVYSGRTTAKFILDNVRRAK